MTISSHSLPDFSALFAASPYPYLLVDTQFVIIGANPAYLSATGRSADDIVGQHIFDAFPADPSDPESTNLAEVRTSIEMAIATGKPHVSALLRYAVPRQTPDGVVFDPRYWSAVHTPVFNAAGEVMFVSQNAIDVTDLYRFDAATRKYYLKPDANVVPDIAQMNQPLMHEAMTRILSAERSALQIMFDQAPGFIAVLTGRDHVFEMVNEAFYKLVGHRAILGKPALEAQPELPGQGLRQLLDQAYDSGQPLVLHGYRLALQRQPGGPLQERHVDLLLQPVIGQDQRVTGVFVQGNDVTAAHEAGLALSEKMLQLEAIRSSQAFQLDLADRIRALRDPDEVTAASCELLGRKLDVLRVLYAEVDDNGKDCYVRRDWTAEGQASLAGQTITLDHFGPEIIASLRTGKAVITEDVRHDHRTVAHGAAYAQIGVQATLLLPLIRAGKLQVILSIHNAQPRVWTAGELQLAQELAERTWPVVETARVQAELRQERDQSQRIFDSMAEGFAVLDRHWRVLRMNAEGLRITQRSAVEVIGCSHWDLWPALKDIDTDAIYRRVRHSGKAEIIEFNHALPDGSQAWVELRAHPSLDDGIAFFFRDVTERRAEQEQLKIADRRKDEFLAMLAHELRNPLAPIGAAAEILQRVKLDEDRVRRTSQIIGRQVAHMTHLINDLLDVSRVTRGLVTLDNAPQDIRHIVAEAVEQVTPVMRARRHQLALHLSPGSTMVAGDKKRLVQVLANILNNAAKYTNEGGNIALRTEVHGEQVLVEVSDDGIGMTADLARHVFDLFAQAERSPDRSAGGLGLGLALVKSLVELHGGTVTCHSAGIGQGSTFTICLPHLAAQEAASPDTKAGALWQPGARSLRILIVDDNVDAASMLGMLLEAAGHRVMVEYGARQALARAKVEACDVCLLDIGLPGMDGNELAQQLRLLPHASRAVLVAVTGYGQESDRQRTQASGFDHHLVKPVDTRQLSAILDRA